MLLHRLRCSATGQRRCFHVFLRQRLDAVFARYDAVPFRVFYFPIAFAENFQTRGTNRQMNNFTPGGRFKADINRLCPIADAGVIRGAQRNPHQGKKRPEQPAVSGEIRA